MFSDIKILYLLMEPYKTLYQMLYTSFIVCMSVVYNKCIISYTKSIDHSLLRDIRYRTIKIISR